MRIVTGLLVSLLLVAPVQAQTLVGLGPFTAAFEYDPASPATFQLYVDGAPAAGVPAGVHTIVFSVTTIGTHAVAVTAKQNGLESAPATMTFSNAAPPPPPPPSPPTITAPECVAPGGARAPSIFPTKVSVVNGGKPGTLSQQNFQPGGVDPIVEIAIAIDGVEQQPIARGADLRAIGSLWFTQPATGSHALSLRVLTSHGCALTRSAGTLVVP